MRLIIALMLLPFLLTGQTISSNAIMDFNTAELSAPCAACTPWRYSRQDSTLRRWDYAQLRWERIATEDQILSRRNDTLFLTNGGFVVLPAGADITGIQDTLDELWDVVMNGDTNTANVLRVFIPTSAITSRSGDPKAPTDSLMAVIARAYQTAGQARPGSILVSQVAATTSNPSHQASSLESSTPFNAWFWDGLRVTRISYGKIAVNLEDTLAGGLNNIPIEPAPDATYASVRKFIDDNHGVLSMPNGTLLYWVGDGSIASPDTVWMVLDNVSDTTRIALLKTKPSSTVELALPSEFNVVNDPELLSASWAVQSPNRVFMGPASGVPSLPTFRLPGATDIAAWGGVTGMGTTNTLPLWSSTTGLGNSIIRQVLSDQALSIGALTDGSFSGNIIEINLAGTGGVNSYINWKRYSGTNPSYFFGHNVGNGGSFVIGQNGYAPAVILRPTNSVTTPNILYLGGIGGAPPVQTYYTYTSSGVTTYPIVSANLSTGANSASGIQFAGASLTGTLTVQSEIIGTKPTTYSTGSDVGGFRFRTKSGSTTFLNAFEIAPDGKVGIGTTTPLYSLEINSADAIRFPVGTTSQRPTGAAGIMRYNTTWGGYDGHNGTSCIRFVTHSDATPTIGHFLQWDGTNWTPTSIPSLVRGVSSNTTDSNGDITVTLPTTMPDATYSYSVTLGVDQPWILYVHTLTTTSFKVGLRNSTTGLKLGAGESVTVSFTTIDY